MHIADGVDMDEQPHPVTTRISPLIVIQEDPSLPEIARRHPLIDHHLHRPTLRGKLKSAKGNKAEER